MPTFLFDQIIFGPVKSRRLGVSLGINLLPTDAKLCNFNCIYCECGWNPDQRENKIKFHARELVAQQLRTKLEEMKADGQLPDVITYAGNGEPTMHPHFAEIIADTINIRNSLCPDAKIAVLSNSTLLDKPSVFDALKRIDQNILKLDSAIDSSMQLINGPVKKISVADVIARLEQFEGNFILQTMFLKGSYKGNLLDNTTEEEISAWLKVVQKTNPKQVMMYTIDRSTPLESLQKIEPSKLDEIAESARALGFDVQVSY